MHLNRLITTGFAGTAVLCMVACSGNGQNGSQGALDPSGPAGTSVAAIAAGNAHTCVLTTAGAIDCWGNNANGQLGISSTTQSDVPVEVTGF